MGFNDLLIDDLDILLDAFGIPATLSDGVHPAKPLRVILDSNSINELGVITDKPQITIKEADLLELDMKNTTITVNDTNYRILKPFSDGSGLVVAGITRI
jgi:hypothetical protein